MDDKKASNSGTLPVADELEDVVGEPALLEIADDAEAEVVAPIVELVPVEDFESLGLDERLLQTVHKIGWAKPTPVQALCLPLSIKGRDVAGFAQTGTGKTGVFLLTVAQKVLSTPDRHKTDPCAIVLAPTRELAMQIESDAVALFADLPIKSLAVFGGMDYEKQANAIRQGVDFIVATPGRLKDYLQKKEFSLDHCALFVCDEADRMLDMGFIEDVEFFLDKLPEKCQRMLFSATTNETVKELAFEYLEKPEYVSVNPEIITPENIDQRAIAMGSAHKLRVLLGLFKDLEPSRSIIFTNTKLVADWLHFKLVNNGIPADIITGDLPQPKRIRLIKKIKAGEIKALVATDVASRGLHIADVSHVFNFDLPDEAANYVHRIGRTARAGAKGISISFVCDDYGQNLVEINELLGPALALKTTWFDPKYTEIKDQAANPYPSGRNERNAATDDQQSGRFSRDRGQRPSGGGGQGRDGGRNSKPRNDNRGPDQRNFNKSESGPRHSNAGRGQGNDRPQGRDRQRLGGGQKDQHRRDNRPDLRQQQNRAPAAAHAATEAQPKGAMAMVKRIFKTIFGSK